MGVKPMNCPGHAHLFGSSRHSYRDLPVRYSEPGLLHRNEASRRAARAAARAPLRPGRRAHLLHRGADPGRGRGLPGVRVRHLQAVRLRRQPRALHAPRAARSGTDEMWDRSRGSADAQRSTSYGLEYELNPGDGAFYGPKIDMHMTDSLGRSWQLGHGAARLLDARALRADLHRRRQRRAHAGDDPPRAVRLLRALHRDPDRALRRRAAAVAGARAGDRAARSPTASTTTARRSETACDGDEVRVELDDRSESIGRKIREAELRKIPYMLVVGEREQRDGAGVACASTAAAISGSMPSADVRRALAGTQL